MSSHRVRMEAWSTTFAYTDVLENTERQRCGRHVGRLTMMAFSWRRAAVILVS